MANKLKAIKRALQSTSDKQKEVYSASITLLNLLQSHSTGGTKTDFAKAVAYTGIAVSSSVLMKNVWEFIQDYRESDSFYVKIRENDRLYQVAESWLMEIMPEEDKISLYTRAVVHESDEISHPSASERKVSLVTSFDGSVVQEVSLGKHKIRLEATQPGSSDSGKGASAPIREFKFMCSTLEAREAVLKELLKRSNVLTGKAHSLYIARSWGNFTRRDAPLRSIDSVFLKENQKERLTKHIRTFLDSEKSYHDIGLPYHTGILLHGDPGTGKSSTASALADEFKMDVYYIPLTVIESDEYLQDAFSNIPPRSMVVLEDIDIHDSTSSRDVDNPRSGVSMQGLLNVLDGQVAPHGVITIMTTNHLSDLDEAIIRPGRVDVLEEINAIDDFQLRNICEYYLGFVPKDLPTIQVKDNISSATVIGIFRKYIPNFQNAEMELIAYLQEILTKETI